MSLERPQCWDCAYLEMSKNQLPCCRAYAGIEIASQLLADDPPWECREILRQELCRRAVYLRSLAENIITQKTPFYPVKREGG